MLEKPSKDSVGNPVCPRCGAGLIYVEENIERTEYKVNKIGIEKSAGSKTLLMPEANEEPLQRETLETLKTYIACVSAPNCVYRVASEYLGEVK